MAGGIDELIGIMQNIVREAWAVPLSKEKCVLERDRVLDLLDGVQAALPPEIRQAQEIVERRNEMLSIGKRDADVIKRQSEERAHRLVGEHPIMTDARRRSNDLVSSAENKSREVRKAANQYCDDVLRRADAAVSQAITEIKQSRQQFRQITSTLNVSVEETH